MNLHQLKHWADRRGIEFKEIRLAHETGRPRRLVCRTVCRLYFDPLGIRSWLYTRSAHLKLLRIVAAVSGPRTGIVLEARQVLIRGPQKKAD